MLILPAIDIRGGKCVRLLKGDYSQETVYGEDPAAMAKQFLGDGAEWIHMVDLDGAKAGNPVNVESLRAVRASVSCHLEVGGGVRSLESIKLLLDIGIDRVILGTVLVKDPEFRRAAFGEYGDRVVAGIDAKDGKIAIAGWEQTSTVDAVESAIEMQSEGATRFIVTDIATDGTLAGPNLEFLRSFTSNLYAYVIASGGIGDSNDLELVAGVNPKVEGVIVGKAIYENRINLEQEFLKYPASIL